MAYDLITKKQTSANWAIGCGTPGRMAGAGQTKYQKIQYPRNQATARRRPKTAGIGAFVGRAIASGVPVPVVQKALVRKGYDPHQIAAIVGYHGN